MIDDNVKHPSHYTDGKIEVIEKRRGDIYDKY